MKKLFAKYTAVIFVLFIFIASFHHHDTLEQYNDCQICTIQSNIDTPIEVAYLSSIELFFETIIKPFKFFSKDKKPIQLQARAPPLFQLS